MATFRRDVLHGLRQPSKHLPCKYFYDERGSQLFEDISRLDEYYLSRCELAILERHAAEMTAAMKSGVTLIEYGSGNSRKTRLLLDQVGEPATYLPVDLNGEQLQETTHYLRRQYPRLLILPVQADFSRPFALPVIERPN
jgi:uncharacterized SAM-dependent methyltransferase